MVVDIQPEYQKYISFLPEFVDFLNLNHQDMQSLVFLYNGHDTLGMVSEDDLKTWWAEYGLEEGIIENAYWYDKGYAFFRYCMDSGIGEQTVANFVRFLYENDINDSRDMTHDLWSRYLKRHRKTTHQELYELMKHSGDCIHIPDLMAYLKSYNNPLICGGGVNECLKEVEIALQALQMPYDVDSRFTY